MPSWIYHADRVPALGDCLWSTTCRSILMQFFFFLILVRHIHDVWYFVFSSVSNSISALPLNFILFSIHGTATCKLCNSSLPPPPRVYEAHDAMDFSTSGVNCTWYASEIVFDIAHGGVADFGQAWNGHDWTVHYFLFYVSSLKLLQVKDFLHYVF